MDIYEREYLYYSYVEKERVDKIMEVISIADAVSMAIIGTKSKSGYSAFHRWRKRLVNEAYPDIAKKEAESTWQSIRRRRRG